MRTLTSKVVVSVLLLTGCGSSVPQPPCEETHYSQEQIEYAVQRAFITVENKRGTLTGSVWEDTALFAELVEEASHELGCTIPAASSSKMLAAKKNAAAQSGTAMCQEVELLESYDSSVGYCGPDAVEGGEVCTLWSLRNPGDCMNQVCFEHDRCYEEADIPKLSVGGSEVEACLWSDVSDSCDNDFFSGFMECVADSECGWGCSIVKAIAATLQAASDVSGLSTECVECAQGGDCVLGEGTGNGGTHDIWVATSTNGAPDGRVDHTAVWTGNEMIVWGGRVVNTYFDTGARYSPDIDTWIPMSTIGAPPPQSVHTAVWTGSEMIIWNGLYLTGARYNPSSDMWKSMSSEGAPLPPRDGYTIVWTGTEMIVWGGATMNGLRNDGGRYNPSTDTWTSMTLDGAPSKRFLHSAIWTGSEMIVWGGEGFSLLNTGGWYSPTTDTWKAVSLNGAPSVRESHTALWIVSEMLIWGGWNTDEYELNDGGRYNPSTNSWKTISTIGAPSERTYHTVVWTGTEMIVWGGHSSERLSDGGRYSPTSDSWSPVSSNNAPIARNLHTAVWTGIEMIVWGGATTSIGISVNTGGRYKP